MKAATLATIIQNVSNLKDSSQHLICKRKIIFFLSRIISVSYTGKHILSL